MGSRCGVMRAVSHRKRAPFSAAFIPPLHTLIMLTSIGIVPAQDAAAAEAEHVEVPVAIIRAFMSALPAAAAEQPSSSSKNSKSKAGQAC
jgi:hypothetical protein